MKEKFFELTEEKRMKIIHAGMEVFGMNDYKDANCDDIAYKASISKGLLFYYFENKKSFYMYLFDFCMVVMNQHIEQSSIWEITDFFDLIDCGAMIKAEIMREYPYMLDFIMKAYYPQKSEVSDEIAMRINQITQDVFGNYFKNIDWSKFKKDVDPIQIYKMMLWMADGYLSDKKRRKEKLDVNEMMQEFSGWKRIFKRICYKEEENECD